MRRLIYFLPVLIVAGLGLGFFAQLGKDASVVPSVLIDTPAPVFDLPAIDGHDRPGLSSADFRGKITLLNVFASWCVPCRAEHPLISALAQRGDIQVIGMNYKDKPEDARKWLGNLGDPYARIGADRDGRVSIDFGVYGVPETYIIDREGIIREKFVGPLTPEHIEKTILPMIRKLSS